MYVRDTSLILCFSEAENLIWESMRSAQATTLSLSTSIEVDLPDLHMIATTTSILTIFVKHLLKR